MAYPTRQITGKIYTLGGAAVTNGKIIAYIVPAGAVVQDTVDPEIFYKISSYTESPITASGITTLFLTTLQSANPLDAYYKLRFQMYQPFKEEWYELWKIVGTAGEQLDIGSVIPLQYGPYLPEFGYAAVQFADALVGAPGPAGPPGTTVPTIVESLPTLNNTMVGCFYLHDRTPNDQSDVLYQVLRDGLGVLYYVELWSA